MKIPPNMTEEQVLADIEKVVATLSSSFPFGIYEPEDIAQQCRLYILELLEKGKYDGKRPFAAYGFVHCRNRLVNLRRDKLTRTDPPCKTCHAGTPCSADGLCKKYQEWKKRNAAKANLQRPLDLNHVADEKEHNIHIQDTVPEDAAMSEMMTLIDEKLSVELRQYYLQIRAGVSVPKAKRDQVYAAIKEILGCQNANEDD